MHKKKLRWKALNLWMIPDQKVSAIDHGQKSNQSYMVMTEEERRTYDDKKFLRDEVSAIDAAVQKAEQKAEAADKKAEAERQRAEAADRKAEAESQRAKAADKRNRKSQKAIRAGATICRKKQTKRNWSKHRQRPN